MHPLNQYFDMIYIINLDRRPDRWKSMTSRFQREGISLDGVTRIQAVDGSAQPYYSAWKSLTTKVFQGQHKLYTPGSYGYLLSMYRIFSHALENDYSRILVCDDDLLFLKGWTGNSANYQNVLDQCDRYPWEICYFGYCHKGHRGLTPPAQEVMSSHHFLQRHGRGSINGSFFNGYTKSVYRPLMDMITRSRLPFDTGPLRQWYTSRGDKVILVSGQIGVQHLHDTDIQPSQSTRRLIEDWGWRMDDYH